MPGWSGLQWALSYRSLASLSAITVTGTDRYAFVRAMSELAQSVGVLLTDGTVDAHWRGLRDLPLPAVLSGLTSAARVCKRLPSVAEVRELSPATEHRPGSQTPGSIGKATCEACEGRGWVSVEVQDKGQLVRLARRCSCRKG